MKKERGEKNPIEESEPRPQPRQSVSRSQGSHPKKRGENQTSPGRFLLGGGGGVGEGEAVGSRWEVRGRAALAPRVMGSRQAEEKFSAFLRGNRARVENEGMKKLKKKKNS